MTPRFAFFLFFAASLAHGDDLRIDRIRESLTGTHIHYQQFLGGIPVIGGERIENINRGGRREVLEQLARRQVSPLASAMMAARAGELVYLNENGEARLASRVIVEEQPFRRYANYYAAATGALIRSDALFWTAQGRVFDPNPVTKLNNPDLQDQNNAATAVPDSAYSIVELADLAPSGPLSGPNVQIVDTESPHPDRADASQPLLFDRSQPQFEEVNAYYHIDRAQRYLQSLGYTGARRIVGYAVPVDVHGASGTDNSFFISGFTPAQGELVFGDGGTDDAEDSDIMLHEYGHAIQEWIAPGAFGGSSSSQSRALGEGFGDYWSFSSTYEPSIASGRDPFCIGDWDARCWKDDASQACGYPVGADCLRRVDGTKTVADFINSDAQGTEHKNGEIWSSALREIFIGMTKRYGVDQGKRLTDTIVLEGTFGVLSGPTFAAMGRKLLDADRAVNGGADVPGICGAMVARGILIPADCVLAPRGEVTWFQSPDHGLTASSITSTLTIADSRPIEKLDLNVVVTGAPSDDLLVSLLAPDGTTAFLKGSFDAFRGHSAGGRWTLTVTTNDGSPVTLASWNLVIQFAGDQPAASRPAASGTTATIAAVAHAAGVNGTNFVSDVRILNRGTSPAQIVAVFTPSGGDGRTDFSAVKIAIEPSQIVALDDIVQVVMLSTGTGQLELVGATDQLVIFSRTYTRGASGTFGQFIPSATAAEAIGSGDAPISIPGLENSDAFRSNIGFAEIAGASGEVRVRFYGEGGSVASDETYGIAPFGHVQTNVRASGEALRAEVTLSGGARVLTYGSVVDNRSGDALFIPAARSRSGFFPAIHAAGALGTIWRTDVWFSNTGAAEPVVNLPTRTVTLPPRGSAVVRDILGSDGRAVLSFSIPDVLVTSRTYTTTATGSFGQFVPPSAAAIRRGDPPATMIGIENSAAFRTNVGLMATTDDPATVRLIAYDASGREVGRAEVLVRGLTQIPLPVALVDGRVSAEVIDGSGSVIPYASVIDNLSGDPIYISAIR